MTSRELGPRTDDLTALRRRHPRLVYRAYRHRIADDSLTIEFDFLLEPDLVFQPSLTIPLPRRAPEVDIDALAFHLGMIELVSYWKAACPPQIHVACGELEASQTAWWIRLFHRGLGEFFYRNGIPPDVGSTLQITSSGADRSLPDTSRDGAGDLLLVGGGKDSAVVLDVIRDASPRHAVLMLNPTPAAIRLMQAAGCTFGVGVKRRIDPVLLRLNASGYLNGHTPFSAYLAFLGVAVARLHGFQRVVVGNERSSSQGNAIVDGFVVNHQYSKSFEFECLFREYCSEYLAPGVDYFSFLRPLWSLQVSDLFAGLTSYHLLFRSCNVAQREDAWCGRCAKCASVFLTLFPFLDYDQAIDIFGSDYFLQSAMEPHWPSLLGIAHEKPFDCVATFEECRAAAVLSSAVYASANRPVPEVLQRLIRESEALSMNTPRAYELLTNWGEHNLPPSYETILRDALRDVESRARA